jgi:hypothetical protein
MIIAGTTGSCIGAAIRYKYKRIPMNPGYGIVAGIAQAMSRIGIYSSLRCVAKIYPICTAGLRLYRDDMYLVKNKI